MSVGTTFKYPNYAKLHQSNMAEKEIKDTCAEGCSSMSPCNITIIASSAIAGGVIGAVAGGGAGVVPGVAIGGLVGCIIVVVKESIAENNAKKKKQT